MSTLKRLFDEQDTPTESNVPNRRARTSVAVNQTSSSTAGLTQHLPSPSPQTIPRPGNSTRENAKAAGYAVLSTLKGSMKLLKGSCGAFGPLHTVAGDLLEVLESMERNKTNSDPELFEMASELPQWASILASYLSIPHSDAELGSSLAERLAGDIKTQLENLSTQDNPNNSRRLLESKDRAEALRQCYRRIETSFSQLQANTAFNTWRTTQEHLQDSRLDKMSPSHNARYDSSFAHKVKRRACLQNTRATVLEDSRRWIYGTGATKVYWLDGMAGTGKTTIAYSVCSELEDNGRLGASFFCSRAASDCQDVNRILPTIAYQLAQQFYPFRTTLCQILGMKPNIAQRELVVQFNHLIRDPLIEVKDLLPSGVVVVIDALDECSDPGVTELILNLLFDDIGHLPIRFYLTSRPEPAVVNTILRRDPQIRSVLHLHNVDQEVVNSDIETYLVASLATTLTRAQIEQLTQRSGVLFIYAATVARYMLSGPAGANRQARLAAVLSKETGAHGTKKDREIDLLYTVILDEILNTDQLEESEVGVIKHVLWAVITAKEPLTKANLAGLLTIGIEDISTALEPLRSVLNVIEGSDVVSPLHASFPEFILNPERSGQWSCRDDRFITTRCFEVMQDQLCFNLCNLKTSFQQDEEVPDLQSRVSEAISPELFYACRYWSEHLHSSRVCKELLSYLKIFLVERLLFWMEALNLKKEIDRGPEILNDAWRWIVDVPGESELITFIRDAAQFVDTLLAHPIRQSTPHIYISGIPLAPTKSRLWDIYRMRMRGMLWLGGGGMDQWHDRMVASGLICHSYNTPGCSDQVAQKNTSCTNPPEPDGHTDTITSVAFSPDSTQMISASWDGTVRVWTTYDGIPLSNPFKDHTDGITSVAFSSDGNRIVSGSRDKTIRVRDYCRGIAPVNSFKGHTDIVTSVSFSPDGLRIASGSRDKTVRVWDSRKAIQLVDSFKGHTDAVASVAFSPDGARVASGSWDKTIRVWSSHRGNLLMDPFRGHTGMITSVAFSPEGSRIASGAWDKTIRVWGSHDGTLLAGPFNGHTDMIASVAFSPDGTRIVSGSRDKTVRVWDSCKGVQIIDPFKGHGDAVTSVAFSPDGARIVSGSYDGTIRTWNSRGGVPIARFFKDDTITTTSRATTPGIVHTPRSGALRNVTGGGATYQARNRGSWYIDDDGWVRGSSKVIFFWIPPALRDLLPTQSDGLVIKDGGLWARFDELFLGNEWYKCYDSADAAAAS